MLQEYIYNPDDKILSCMLRDTTMEHGTHLAREVNVAVSALLRQSSEAVLHTVS